MSRGAGIVVGLATALVIVAISIVPLLSGPWLTFAQGRAQVGAWTGWPEPDVRAVTSAIVADLVTAGDFDVALDGRPVLTDRERSHMRDVQVLFIGFYAFAVSAATGLVFMLRGGTTGAAWRAIRGGAIGLTAVLVVAGLLLTFAFDAAFALFHRLFFASGSWTFDPATDRLIQLFPQQFWVETTAAAGVIALVLALGVARYAGLRRA